MLAQHVADILAQKTLDALAKFLHAVDVRLRHAPRAIGCIGRTGLELLDLLFHPEIPRDVGHQIADQRKGFHRLDSHGLCRAAVRSAASCT